MKRLKRAERGGGGKSLFGAGAGSLKAAGKMKLSSKTHYGLMACYILGESYGKAPVSATALEAKISVSAKYLEKIMRMLTGRGIVAASRGKEGGYYLAAPPEQIKVGDIVRALEDDMEFIECVAGSGACKCCPTSAVWKKLYNGINELLDSVTVKDMLCGAVE